MFACVQVKNVYVRFLYHCYIDTEVDNKETFTKEHVWELFKSFLVDIAKVSRMFCLWPGTVFLQVLASGCMSKNHAIQSNCRRFEFWSLIDSHG